MDKIKTLVLSGLVVSFMMVVSFAADKPAAKTPTTLENLQTAFNGESNAKVRYEAFSVKADAEGYAGVAGFFRAAALSEGIHAARHAKAIEAMGGMPKAEPEALIVKSTKENLKAVLKDENSESKKIYPAFVKQALVEKNNKAAMSFKGAMATEVSHAKLCSQALAKLGDWKEKMKFIVCQTCGYTTNDLSIKLCPVCSQPREQFTQVE